jgi:hypothetical protein
VREYLLHLHCSGLHPGCASTPISKCTRRSRASTHDRFPARRHCPPPLHHHRRSTPLFLSSASSKATITHSSPPPFPAVLQALQHYTRAISLSPKDGALYSNRSFAFLKLAQPARALSDADESIRKRPSWAKGHFRRAEALREAGLHAEAVESYARGAALDPSDSHLREQREASLRRAAAQARAERVWVAAGAAGGFALLALLAAAPDMNIPGMNSPAGRRAEGGGGGLGIAGRAAAAVAGAAIGGAIAAGLIVLRAHGRRGAVLPPLESNDRFVAMQAGGGGLGPQPAAEAPRGMWGAAPAVVPIWENGNGAGGPPVEGGMRGGAAGPGGLGAGAGSKAGGKRRAVKHGRAAALRAMGKPAAGP